MRAIAAAAIFAGAALAASPEDLMPPVIAPVWPTRFSSKTYGSVDFKAGGHKNFTADWFYDWPNARHLYNGTETFHLANGTSYVVKYVRFWNGPTAKNPTMAVHICDLDVTTAGATTCKCQDIPKFLLAQIERPDGFARANMTFVAREAVQSVQADHFVGPVFSTISPAPFEVWQDPTTNFPVLFAGPVGYQGDTGTRYFTEIKAFGESGVTDDVFKVDRSSCNNGTAVELSANLLHGPMMLPFPAVSQLLVV